MMTPHEQILLRAVLAVLDAELDLPQSVRVVLLDAVNVVSRAQVDDHACGGVTLTTYCGTIPGLGQGR